MEKYLDNLTMWLTIMGLSFLALMGGLARRALLVQEGKLPVFFDKSIWLDLPATIVAAVVAMAINEYFLLTGWTAAAVVVLCCYVGVRVVLVVLARLKGISINKDEI